MNILPTISFLEFNNLTYDYSPANLTKINYTRFVNVEFQVHYANISVEKSEKSEEGDRSNETVIERYPMKICNESDFLAFNASSDWERMSNESRLTQLCPSNITNLSMQAGNGTGMYLRSFKFVVG
jgi:hypothetical protein